MVLEPSSSTGFLTSTFGNARLAEFFSVDASQVGTFGGGRKRQLTGRLDIAGVRSLAKLHDGELASVLERY